MRHLWKFILLIVVYALPLQGIWFDVCIDPGHCGDADPGSLGANGSAEPDESDFNLDMALICYDDLTYNYGYSVILTRYTETYTPKLDPGMKAEIANGARTNDYNEKTDYPVGKAVSIHCNGGAPSAHGTETYVRRALDYPLAQSVHNKAFNYLQMFPYANNRGIIWGSMWFLARCKMPACLIEVAFCTHDPYPNGQWYQLRDNQGGFKDFAAYGIDEGITGVWFLRPPVTNLRMPWESGRSLTLVWHPTTVQDATYSIYRREHPNTNYILIHSGTTDSIYVDNSVNSGVTYSYYVQAVRGSQTGAPSNVISIQTPPFHSDNSTATAYNNGSKIVAIDENVINIIFSADTAAWGAFSVDCGTTWSSSCCRERGLSPAIAVDGSDNPHVVNTSFAGIPDTASGEDTTYCIYYSQHLADSIWKNISVYSTSDTILSIGFAIDQHDTGWVVFNTYDEEANNELKIGQFYTQSEPESLDNVTILDTYIRHGLASVAVRQSDRSIWVVYERNNDVMCKWRDTDGIWQSNVIAHNAACPSLSTVDNYVHIIWEQHYENSDYRQIRILYNNGLCWSRMQTIATVTGRNCYPYIASGAVAVWADIYQGQWDVFSSRRNKYSVWTTPQNISQT
ncbi:MAG: N-acetylmuramoyl-L-alanine amidase, partial [bacterium]